MSDHECNQEARLARVEANLDRIEAQLSKFTLFSGQIGEAVNTMKDDINALFEQNRKILKAINALDKSTAVETTKLKVRYGIVGSLITAVVTLLGVAVVWFYKS
jgi:hypothetical protein